jgi:hypothetical protein
MNNYHKVFTFPNGYSASVVSHAGSYGGDGGLFEVAVMFNNEIVYDTPVTSDVVGFLDFQGVADTLNSIRILPDRHKC